MGQPAHPSAGLGDIGVQFGVLGGAVIRRKLMGGVLFVQADLLVFADQHQLTFTGDRIGGASSRQAGRSH